MIYAFGEFELDEDRFQLRWRSEPLDLEPKIFEVLAYLISNRDRVVPKQELLDTLWHNQIVGDWSLTRTISVARKTLEDAGADRALIQTVYGRGYRFNAPVIEREAEAYEPRSARQQASNLVGRQRQLDDLQAALASAAISRGRTIFVAGESGVGKSRLVEELATIAEEQGHCVRTGRCWENETAPAFWPWIQILREQAHHFDNPDVLERVGVGFPHLKKLLADSNDGSEPPSRTTPSISNIERFQLFDSVARFVKAIAWKQLQVLVFEDLHAADETSLRLLGFVGREISGSSVLIVATVRDDYLIRGSDEEQRLSAAARAASAQHIALEPLSENEVEEFLARATGRAWRTEAVATVHRQTGGNTFFLSQLAPILAELDENELEATSSLERILPRSLRQSVLLQLSGLSPVSGSVLELACAMGLRFARESLRNILDVDAESFERAIEQLNRRSILLADTEDPQLLRFTHGLVRDTLYAELAPEERGRLHLRIAEELKHLPGADQLSHVTELAHHFFEARNSGAMKQAYEYAILAARQSAGQLAYEDARHHYVNALAISDRIEDLSNSERADLLVALGRCQQRAGSREAASETLERAAELARGMGDVERLAQIAIISSETVETFGNAMIDPPTIRLLESALTLLPKGDSSLRARVMAALAINGYWDPDRFVEAHALADKAVEMSRRLGDDSALLDSLVELCRILVGPVQGFETNALLDEGIRLAERLDVPELMGECQRIKMWNLFAEGRIDEAEAEAAAAEPTFERLAGLRREFLGWWQNSRAIMRGEFKLADAIGSELLESAERRDSARGVTVYAALFLSARWAQGRLGEVAEIATHLERGYTEVPIAATFAARAQAALKNLDGARERLERLVTRDGPTYHKTWAWLPSTCLLGEVAVAVGDVPRCHALYQSLLPYAQRHVSGSALTYLGSASYYLGQLARHMGWLTVAEQQLHSALEMHASVGARPLVAWAHLALAELAAERGRYDDAAKNAAATLELAEKLHVPNLADRARQLAG